MDKLNLNAEALVLTRNHELFLKKAPHLTTNPAIIMLKNYIYCLLKARFREETISKKIAAIQSNYYSLEGLF